MNGWFIRHAWLATGDRSPGVVEDDATNVIALCAVIILLGILVTR